MGLSEKGHSLAGCKALSGIKTPPTLSQKPIICYLWITIGILLLRSVVLGVLLSVLFQESPEKEPSSCQPQNATNRPCLPKSPEEKGQECCMNDWVINGSSCYYFSWDTANWGKSRQKCTDMHADLVVLNSEAEQDFLTTQVEARASQEANFVIGLSDLDQIGQWQWVDETPFNNTAAFWSPGSPSRRGEYCVAMHILKGRYTDPLRNWNDRKCTTRCFYICETRPHIPCNRPWAVHLG